MTQTYSLGHRNYVSLTSKLGKRTHVNKVANFMKDPGTERNVQILLVYSTLVHLKRFTPQTPHQLAKMLTTNHNKWAFFFFFEVNQSNTDKKT